MPGVPMSVDYHRWRHTAKAEVVREDFARATSWLRELRHLPVDRVLGARGDWQALATRLHDRWPAGEAASDVASEVAERLTDLDSRLLMPPGSPLSVVHGDFWCGNVLRTGRRVTGVVDWEHAVVGGDPVRDLARFVVSLPALPRSAHPAGARRRRAPRPPRGRLGEPIRYAAHGVGWLPSRLRRSFPRLSSPQGETVGSGARCSHSARPRSHAHSDHADFARQHLLLAAEPAMALTTRPAPSVTPAARAGTEHQADRLPLDNPYFAHGPRHVGYVLAASVVMPCSSCRAVPATRHSPMSASSRSWWSVFVWLRHEQVRVAVPYLLPMGLLVTAASRRPFSPVPSRRSSRSSRTSSACCGLPRSRTPSVAAGGCSTCCSAPGCGPASSGQACSVSVASPASRGWPVSARRTAGASLTFDDPNLAANYFLVCIALILATSVIRRVLTRVLAIALVLLAIIFTARTAQRSASRS